MPQAQYQSDTILSMAGQIPRGGRENGASDENAYKAEIQRLERIIGKQAIQIEILKKTEELFGKR